MSEGATILWRRLDIPGHEIATIARRDNGWSLTGLALLAHSANPCRIEYDIHCDSEWITRTCAIRGSIGTRPVSLDIERGAAGDWTVGGAHAVELDGCDDIDLGFSPVTNLLPIRRLGLPVGSSAAVRAAWVRFPEFTLEVLEQTYARLESTRYKYESAGGAFRRELTTNEFGFVVEYPGLWVAEAVQSTLK